jgi:hypothetical protein
VGHVYDLVDEAIASCFRDRYFFGTCTVLGLADRGVIDDDS